VVGEGRSLAASHDGSNGGSHLWRSERERQWSLGRLFKALWLVVGAIGEGGKQARGYERPKVEDGPDRWGPLVSGREKGEQIKLRQLAEPSLSLG
jgi:hypothetical protein